MVMFGMLSEGISRTLWFLMSSSKYNLYIASLSNCECRGGSLGQSTVIAQQSPYAGQFFLLLALAALHYRIVRNHWFYDHHIQPVYLFCGHFIAVTANSAASPQGKFCLAECLFQMTVPVKIFMQNQQKKLLFHLQKFFNLLFLT